MLGFVCLEVEKAFYVVRRLRLQNKLQKIGVHKLVIKGLTSQRSIFLKANNSKSSIFSKLAGVPQGSVIAPILFLVYVSGIFDLSAQISQSVDDLALYYRSSSSRIFQEKLQYLLDKLFKSCEKLKITTKPGRNNFMFFMFFLVDKYNSIIDNIQLTQNRALRIRMREPTGTVSKTLKRGQCTCCKGYSYQISKRLPETSKPKTRLNQYLKSSRKRDNVQKTVIKAHWSISPVYVPYI